MKENLTKVVAMGVRLSYAHVWEPKAQDEGEEPKYSVCLLIPKADTKTLQQIEKAVEAAKTAGKAMWGGTIPHGLKLPLRDGDEERPGDEAYEGMLFLNCSSKTAPGIVDKQVRPITDRGEVYSGCWCNVSVNFYPFNAKERNKGIAVGLNNIQKVRDGDALAGGSTPEEDFAPYEETDDDMLD